LFHYVRVRKEGDGFFKASSYSSSLQARDLNINKEYEKLLDCLLGNKNEMRVYIDILFSCHSSSIDVSSFNLSIEELMFFRLEARLLTLVIFFLF
jgi:hypothetical protein